MRRTLAAAVLLVACEGAPAEPPLPLGPVEVLGHRGFVVAPSRLEQPIESHPWQPTRSELEAFERALGPHVRAMPPSSIFRLRPEVDLARALDGYLRFYGGEHRGERRVIRVDLFCAGDLEPVLARLPPLTERMTMNDGGECNCGALFDPETGEVISFGCAGDA